MGLPRAGDQMFTSAAYGCFPAALPTSGSTRTPCTVQDIDLATMIRVTPPGAGSAFTLSAPSQRIVDYCGRGVVGSVVDITPVQPDIRAVFAHHCRRSLRRSPAAARDQRAEREMPEIAQPRPMPG